MGRKLDRRCLVGGAGALLTAFVLLAACAGDGASTLVPSEDAGRIRFDAATPADAPELSALDGGDGGDGGPCEAAMTTRSPLGCEYAIATAGPTCAVVFVSNPNDEPVRLALRRGSASFDIAPVTRLITGVGNDAGWSPLVGDTLPAGASAVIGLIGGDTSDAVCPALADPTVLLLEGATGPAFSLSASAPVFVTHEVGYFPEVGAVATTALRATSASGTEHIDVGVLAPGHPHPNDSSAQAFAIVTASAQAVVTLAGADGGVIRTLHAGEAHRFQRDDLFIGSHIKSSRPVSVVMGAPVVSIPYGLPFSGRVLSQVPALAEWRSEYAAVGFPPRKPGFDDPPLYRIIAAKEGTHLHFDPMPAPDAPTELEAGGLAMFRSPTPFVVRSQDDQHPIYVSVAMTGSEPLCDRKSEDGGVPTDPNDVYLSSCPGAPALVGVVPHSEYATKFSFVAGHQLPDTYLVLVRKRADSGAFADVTLDCAGVVDGWTPIGAEGIYETVTLPLSRGTFEPQPYAGGVCQLGPHRMSSAEPFTGYLWAWSHDINGPEFGDGTGQRNGFALYGLRD